MKKCKKVCHDEATAQRRVEKMKASPLTKRGYLLHAYRCVECRAWHVGKNWILGIQQLCIGEMK